jgi:hypothetical protein
MQLKKLGKPSFFSLILIKQVRGLTFFRRRLLFKERPPTFSALPVSERGYSVLETLGIRRYESERIF